MHRRQELQNRFTDVAGLRVGHAVDLASASGVTVIVCDRPTLAAVDVRGGGPASRELDVLRPENLVQHVDAVTFSGGSVYGLAAADGVTQWCRENGRGFRLAHVDGVPPSPIVPCACLYDLANGGHKTWASEPPYRRLGRDAAEKASADMEVGSVGAGFGARAGALLGGVGSASSMIHDLGMVSALAVVNSFGSVVVPGSRAFWAAPFELGDEFGGVAPARCEGADEWGLAKVSAKAGENTTLACVATDVALTRVELKRIAIMAQDGCARAIRPVHTPFDGDIVFALSTSATEIPEGIDRAWAVTRIGSRAADTLARAIARGVFSATPGPGRPGTAWRDLVP